MEILAEFLDFSTSLMLTWMLSNRPPHLGDKMDTLIRDTIFRKLPYSGMQWEEFVKGQASILREKNYHPPVIRDKVHHVWPWCPPQPQTGFWGLGEFPEQKWTPFCTWWLVWNAFRGAIIMISGRSLWTPGTTDEHKQSYSIARSKLFISHNPSYPHPQAIGSKLYGRQW